MCFYVWFHECIAFPVGRVFLVFFWLFHPLVFFWCFSGVFLAFPHGGVFLVFFWCFPGFFILWCFSGVFLVFSWLFPPMVFFWCFSGVFLAFPIFQWFALIILWKVENLKILKTVKDMVVVQPTTNKNQQTELIFLSPICKKRVLAYTPSII